MLLELTVQSLLLIEDARLELAPGLNVITGETGAGKTVLAHALDLLLGGRPRSGIVRPGASEAYVEGVFDLPDALPDAIAEKLAPDADELVLARRVGEDGRTRAYLNGRAATVGELRELGGALVSFYGQHEHRRLTIAAKQLQLLDETCGSEQALRLRACAESHAQTRCAQERLQELRELAGARECELDLLEFELAEIDAAAPEQGEYERLLATRERLRRHDALCAAAGAGAEALAPDSSQGAGVATLLAVAGGQLDDVADVDARLDGLAERLRAVAIEAGDLAGELRAYAEQGGLEDSSSEQPTLDGVEERLAALERLMRKHGGDIRGVLDHAERSRARHEELAGAELALERQHAGLAQAQAQLDGHALALREAREQAAPLLERGVCEQLAALGMADATFAVRLSEREPGPAGADEVEFTVAPNRGVPAGPLREIASGGELSRVMLALAVASDGAASPPRRLGKSESGHGPRARRDGGRPAETFVFDEIDAGIGGHAARAVGARLRELGAKRQVLCITHLPQIASLGERHFSIVKESSDRLARTSVVQLDEREVVSELVRMLGADEGDSTARKHARDLRKAA